MPSILMTNLYLVSNTGSELHTVEVARYFSKRGWDVTCFCFVCAEPILGLLRRDEIKVIDLAHMNELESSYDVLFAQHRVVSECVWNRGDITFGKVIVSILGLSSVTKHEDLPYFYDDADLMVFISEEARGSAEKAHGRLTVPTTIVPNYYTEEFEDIPAKALPSSPRRIAVISNHIVSELAGLDTIACEKDIQVDYFGTERKSVPITPELIDSYDVIITIGRTVPMALALGVPVYCYDRFGGPGYITSENFEEGLRFNFSGRNDMTRRSSREILDEVLEDWAKATKASTGLREVARERLCFSALMGNLEGMISSLAPREKRRAKAISSAAVLSNVLECFEIREQQLSICRVGQVFYVPESHPGTEFSEDCSVRFLYRLNTQIDICIDEFVKTGDKLIGRLDPMDGEACVCTQPPEGVLAANCAITSSPVGSIFLTNDPIYTVTPCKKVSFSASTIDCRTNSAVTEIMESLGNRIVELESNLNSTKEEYERLSQESSNRILELEEERDSLMTKMRSIRFGVKNLMSLCRERLL